MMHTFKIFLIILTGAYVSCSSQSKKELPVVEPNPSPSPVAELPPFDADSAYAQVAKQVAFGPRVPNTAAHKACGDYLVGELKRFGAQLYVQEMTLTAYNGERLQSRNIIGSYNPSNARRILLFAHWDTRPYADNETDPARQRQPIDGADDGGSGVGVLLEIARLLNQHNPAIGVDIIFFDAEDYGKPDFDERTYAMSETWCLGSQFWARNPHTPNYKAAYGILLDMVGARNAVFYQEGTSLKEASSVVEKVWNEARNLGYGKYFINQKGNYSITDDHIYVIAGRKIPCIDIVNYDTENVHGFGDHWHTHRDKLDNISRETLKAVGQTVWEVINKE